MTLANDPISGFNSHLACFISALVVSGNILSQLFMLGWNGWKHQPDNSETGQIRTCQCLWGILEYCKPLNLSCEASKGIYPAHALTCNSISKRSLTLSAWLASNLSPGTSHSGLSNWSFSQSLKSKERAALLTEHFTVCTVSSSFHCEPLNPVKQVTGMIVQFYTQENGHAQTSGLASQWAARSEHTTRCPEHSPRSWCEGPDKRKVFHLQEFYISY